MNRNVWIGIGIVVVVTVAAFFIYRKFQSPPIINTPSAGMSIVAFGDSLVQGVGASSAEKNFVSLVSARIGLPITNLGKSGDTTRSALTRLPELRAMKPDLVIVLLGGNDYLQRIPKEETFVNLGTIVGALQSDGAAVLLLGVRGGALRDTYESDFARFARAHGTGYISNVLDNLLGNRKFMFDQIHPNDAGYAVIAGRVVPVVKEMLGR